MKRKNKTVKKLLHLNHKGSVTLSKLGALALNNYHRYMGSPLTASAGDNYTATIRELMVVFGRYVTDPKDLPFEEIEIG